MSQSKYPQSVDALILSTQAAQCLGTSTTVTNGVNNLLSSALALESFVGINNNYLDGNNVRTSASIVSPAGATDGYNLLFTNNIDIELGQSGRFIIQVIGKCLVGGTGSGAMVAGDVFSAAYAVTFSNPSGTLAQVGSTTIIDAIANGSSTSMASCTFVVSNLLNIITLTSTPTPAGASTTGTIQWVATVEGEIAYYPIPGMFAWWRADSLNPGNVAAWSDLSGNNNTLVQATPANQPVCIVNTIGAKPGVLFSNSQVLLCSSFSSTLTNPFTIYLVGNTNYANSSSLITNVLISNSTSNITVFSYPPNVTTQVINLDYFNVHGTQHPVGTFQTIVPHIYCMSPNLDTFNDAMWVDSYSTADTAGIKGTSTSMTDISVGNNASGTSCCGGVISEIIIYSGVHAYAQRTTIMQYLSSRYRLSITSNASFNPLSLGNCSIWLRADKGVSLSGSAVTAWADQSGTGNNFVAGVGGSPAFVSNAINGQPGITTTGTESLDCAALASSIVGPVTIYVVTIINSSGTRVIFDSIIGQRLRVYGNSGVHNLFINGINQIGFTDANPGIFCAALDYDGTNDGLFYNSYDITEIAGPKTSVTLTDFRLGNSQTAASPLGGPICELILYNTVHTPVQRRQVAQYLGDRYQLSVI